MGDSSTMLKTVVALSLVAYAATLPTSPDAIVPEPQFVEDCPFGAGSPFHACCKFKNKEDGMKCVTGINEAACKNHLGANAAKEAMENCVKDAMPKIDDDHDDDKHDKPKCPFDGGSPFHACCKSKNKEDGMKCVTGINEAACKKHLGANAAKEAMENCVKDAMPKIDDDHDDGSGPCDHIDPATQPCCRLTDYGAQAKCLAKDG